LPLDIIVKIKKIELKQDIGHVIYQDTLQH
jgi:hypothetical protein